jgi:carboxypeptidase C (cathepsin A)
MRFPTFSLALVSATIAVAAAGAPNDEVTVPTDNDSENMRWHWPWDKKKHKDTAEAKADEIKVLPGWQDVLPSRMFSGLVDAGTDVEGNVTYTMHEHYFFVESEGDPMKDPLIVWTNGGMYVCMYVCVLSRQAASESEAESPLFLTTVIYM